MKVEITKLFFRRSDRRAMPATGAGHAITAMDRDARAADVFAIPPSGFGHSSGACSAGSQTLH